MVFSQRHFFNFAFACFLILPIIDQLTGISKKIVPSSENRKLAHFPSFQQKAPKTYVKQLDNWYADNFGFRNAFFRGFSLVKYHGLGVSPLPKKVTMGKDGWLFQEKSGRKYSIQTAIFRPQKMAIIQKRLEEKQAWLEKQGIRFYIAVAPSRVTTCTSYLPRIWARDSLRPTQLEQLASYLRKESSLDLIDLRKGFPADIPMENLFRKYDIHWNALWAYYGAAYLMKQVQKDFPQLHFPALSQFRDTLVKNEGGSFSNMTNLPLKEDIPGLLPIEPCYEEYVDVWRVPEEIPEELDWRFVGQLHTNNIKYKWPMPKNYQWGRKEFLTRFKCDQLPYHLKAFVIHDSFMEDMKPVLNSSFSHVLYHHSDKKSNFWFDKEQIIREDIDIVIIEIAEISLRQRLLSPAFQ